MFYDAFKNYKHNQLKTRQGLIFFTGCLDKDKLKIKDGLLHSEPKITEPRIFISIVPGTKSEISYHKNMGVVYVKKDSK